MMKFSLPIIGIASVLLMLLALVMAGPALAASGDYGVNSGASTSSSNCGGTGQPACTMFYDGYPVTYSSTLSDGTLVYTFDAFTCTLYISTNGNAGARGSECDQYQPSGNYSS